MGSAVSRFSVIVRMAAAVVVLASLAGATVVLSTAPPASAQTGATPAISTGQAILEWAEHEAGVPYCNGGGGIDGPSQVAGCSAPGFDCMSLSQFAVYQVTGITVPANGEELPGGTDWDGQGTRISPSDLQPGDVVFFGGTDLWHYAHSGIYAGNGEVWDALQTGTPVEEHSIATLQSLYSGYWGGVRYQGDGGPYPDGPTARTGYDLVGADGGVFAFGDTFYGSLPGLGVHVDDITGMVATASDTGYYLVGSDGGVFAFNAPFVNSLPGIGVHVDDIVGIVPTADDQGYFLVGSDGGVFAFNAPFENSLPGIGVHVDDIVGIAATPDDQGYWLVGSNGSVYAFGDAPFYGPTSTGAVAITSTPNGGGYWVVSANGTVTNFGDAGDFSDLPDLGVSVDNIVGIIVSGDGQGYNLIGSDGGIFSFGDATYEGSLPGLGVHVDDVVGGVAT
jgi:hypothetical protein